MNVSTYLFLPGRPTQRLDEATASRLPSVGADPGGFFHDYLRDGTQAIRGVRYFLMAAGMPCAHPVLRAFAHDARFFFHAGREVDILFDAADADAPRDGRLAVDGAQEFAGSRGVDVQGETGLCIVVDESR